MKTRKGKRSEPFWPSIVMKKWLNIKPKVYDFSEDEVDTETESEEDAYSAKEERTHMREDNIHRTLVDPSVSATRSSDTPSKASSLRHKRGKSETLRAQYIHTKDVRLTIGTWNVAGRLPDEDLEMDLGAEDNTPIRKWEAMIRRTLNRSSEPKSKHKSYSAPPSPVLSTTSAADNDILAETCINTGALATPGANCADGKMEKRDLVKVIDIEKNKLKRLYEVEFHSKFDWPEQSLDAAAHVPTSHSKLRRVLSSSARIGLDCIDNPVTYRAQNFRFHSAGLTRVHHSSGNLDLMWKEQQGRPQVSDSIFNVTDAFSDVDDDEEEVATFCELREDENMELNAAKSHDRHVRIVSKQMIGIYVSVWVKRRLRRHIHNLKVSPVGVGLHGKQGQKDGAEQRRNSDVNEILKRTQFSTIFDNDQPRTIPSHESDAHAYSQIFWFGDLNYRLNISGREVGKLVALKRWDELLKYDQLHEELRSGHAFDGWKEGRIEFPPTYKYEINCDKYAGEKSRGGEKKRSPAWCDRILWLGKGIKQRCYKRASIQLSDHRPVSSIFHVEIEVFDHRRLQRALHFGSAISDFNGDNNDRDDVHDYNN